MKYNNLNSILKDLDNELHNLKNDELTMLNIDLTRLIIDTKKKAYELYTYATNIEKIEHDKNFKNYILYKQNECMKKYDFVLTSDLSKTFVFPSHKPLITITDELFKELENDVSELSELVKIYNSNKDSHDRVYNVDLTPYKNFIKNYKIATTDVSEPLVYQELIALDNVTIDTELEGNRRIFSIEVPATFTSENIKYAIDELVKPVLEIENQDTIEQDILQKLNNEILEDVHKTMDYITNTNNNYKDEVFKTIRQIKDDLYSKYPFIKTPVHTLFMSNIQYKHDTILELVNEYNNVLPLYAEFHDLFLNSNTQDDIRVWINDYILYEDNLFKSKYKFVLESENSLNKISDILFNEFKTDCTFLHELVELFNDSILLYNVNLFLEPYINFITNYGNKLLKDNNENNRLE